MSLLGPGLSAMEYETAALKKGGYALLDMYIQSFQEMARQGTTMGGLEANLQTIAAEAIKAKEAGEINLVFYSRLARILALTKLIIQPDRGSLLGPIVVREIADFVEDVTGESSLTRTGGVAIGQVANAIAEELINLQLYLDTLDKREALRKKLVEGMASSPDKK
jgi:hypothetical protein